MRRLAYGLQAMTLAFASSAHAQLGTQPHAEVTLADLQGVTIHASWTTVTRFRVACVYRWQNSAAASSVRPTRNHKGGIERDGVG